MNKLTSITIALAVTASVVLGLGPIFSPEAEGLSDTELEIEFFSDRLESRPADVISATRLGQAYRLRQRETSDIAYLAEAEKVLRQGLEVLPGYAPAELALARVAIDLHRFEEGLALAASSNAKDPQPDAVLAMGDAYLALGDYERAEEVFAGLALEVASPQLAARLARIAELHGDLEVAIRSMEEAYAQVSAVSPLGEGPAWFATRLADLYLSAGRTDEAENHFRLALGALGNYAPAVAGLGDVAIGEGDLQGAIDQLERASELATDPAWLFALSDLHSELGHSEESSYYLDAALATVDQFRSIHPRDFALHYAASSQPALALRFAEAALSQSGDIYAHDVMAIALNSAGRHQEAWTHMEKALELGTVEPVFHLHAGAILAELGDGARAAEHLQTALDIGLDPWDERAAKELLGSLRP